jgi:hypothetical protein
MATATAPDSEIKVKIGKMIFYITAAVGLWFFYWFAGIQCPCWAQGTEWVNSPYVFRWAEEELKMGQTILYILISTVICVAYFTLVDHYLMDMQGLDYWYLFRK